LTEGWGRRGSATSTVLLLAVLAAGCAHCPVPERIFDRADPHNALTAFAYAVETGDYRFAYDTLTPKSRELITFSKFRFALRWGLSAPELGNVSIRKLIVDSKRKRSQYRKDPRHVGVEVEYLEGTEVIKALIWLEREPEAEAETLERIPIWRLDLKETFEQNWTPGTPAAVPSPPAGVKTAR